MSANRTLPSGPPKSKAKRSKRNRSSAYDAFCVRVPLRPVHIQPLRELSKHSGLRMEEVVEVLLAERPAQVFQEIMLASAELHRQRQADLQQELQKTPVSELPDHEAPPAGAS